MLLVLDMGNTNITIGVFEGKQLRLESRIATNRKKMEDQYAVELLDILRLYNLNEHNFDGAIISSVVPPLNRVLRLAVKQVTGVEPLFVGPGTKTGINIRIDNPAELGADLLVGAVAAVSQYGAPCIVWDLGTATKVSIVDKDGVFRGGAIMAGVNMSLEALATNASLLPQISLKAPAKVVGTNTIECMQSGAVFGTASLIDGMTDRIEQELGYPVKVIATGGLGCEIAHNCRREVVYNGNLLLKGLYTIFEKNKK